MKADPEFRFHTQEILRFGDQDSQGHINNAVYSTLFECNRVAFQTTASHLKLESDQVVVVAAVAIDFLRELHWPGTVDIKLGVSNIGNSSFGFAQELWLESEKIATAKSTQVVIHRSTRKPMPLSKEQRAQLNRWSVTI